MLRNKYFSILITLLFVLTLTGCGKKDKTAGTPDKIAYSDTVSVVTSKVTKKDIKLVKSFSSTLEGEDQGNIISKIPERITEINVKSGDYVK